MDWRLIIALAAFAVIALASLSGHVDEAVVVPNSSLVKLPKPETKGTLSVEEALNKRRSIRQYKNQPLTLKEISQLLWSAQGLTAEWGGRTAPSAGATYPLEAYAVVGNVDGLKPGVYHYLPKEHAITQIVSGDLRGELADAALGQSMIKDAPATIILTANYNRTTSRYGNRGVMYVHMEAGHAGQNIYLQAEAIGLGTVAVGAFNPDQVRDLLSVSKDEEPLYIYPVGRV
ncbi:MAG: SagB/ThcOx family dehydrogenase [Candidatus Altiarchaeota archaeon]